jgi:hypothetical protein
VIAAEFALAVISLLLGIAAAVRSKLWSATQLGALAMVACDVIWLMRL